EDRKRHDGSRRTGAARQTRGAQPGAPRPRLRHCSDGGAGREGSAADHAAQEAQAAAERSDRAHRGCAAAGYYCVAELPATAFKTGCAPFAALFPKSGLQWPSMKAPDWIVMSWCTTSPDMCAVLVSMT